MLPGLALLVAAAIWGLTFPLVKDALNHIGPFEFLAIRFGIATVVLAAIWPDAARKSWKVGLRAGLIAGSLLALGHGFQTAGLELTRSTNAGFITGLYVVFTPLIAAVALRRRPTLPVLIGVVITTTGLGLMSLQVTGGRATVNLGDVLVLLAAIAYAGQIVTLGRYSPTSDVRVLTLQQLALTFVAFAVVMPVEEIRAPVSATVWIALLATALGSSVFGIGVQTWAQRRISPTRAAVIFATEAPFAAFFARILADERLAPRAWVGAALILAGMLVVEIRPGRATQEA